MTRIPILLIAFNRPEHTRKVLVSIVESNPRDLYVFQDGARKDNVLDGEKMYQGFPMQSSIRGVAVWLFSNGCY